MTKAMQQRMKELNHFLNGGIFYWDWMISKFEAHPDLLTFPLENVPKWIADGVDKSVLAAIDPSEITSSHFALDRFSFTLPVALTSFGAGGYWGDPYQATGHLKFNIGYHENNRLSINASYDVGALVVCQGRNFNLDTAEQVISDYVRNLCNGLQLVATVETNK